MRTPHRKPGKYSRLKPDPHLTAGKILELKKKLEAMKKSQPARIAEVKRLALDGDFSENVAYSIAKGRLRGLNQKILDIENHLKSAIVIKPSNKNIVSIGNIVATKNNNKIKIFTILGSSETDPSQGIISHNSPIGRALINKKVGDIAQVKLKDKIQEYKITKIQN